MADWGVEVKVTYNRIPQYIGKLKVADDLGLDKWASELELDAVAETPVETGALRASRYRITPIVDEFESAVTEMMARNPKARATEKPEVHAHGAAVGFAANYALFVDAGHHTRSGGFVPANPFFTRAIEAKLPSLRDAVAEKINEINVE